MMVVVLMSMFMCSCMVMVMCMCRVSMSMGVLRMVTAMTELMVIAVGVGFLCLSNHLHSIELESTHMPVMLHIGSITGIIYYIIYWHAT